MEDVNVLAVLVAGIMQMIVGYVWYGPLFGKPWMALVGIDATKMDEMKKGMGKTYGLMFVASLVTAYVLAHFISYAGATTPIDGAVGGFWAWLGFVATTMFTGVLFLKKPMNLYYIDAGYHLVSLMLMGALLAVWG